MSMIISQVCYYVLASIGVEALAYGPVVVLGLYASLLDGDAIIELAGSTLTGSVAQRREMSEPRKAFEVG
jgi:hypothetical protein